MSAPATGPSPYAIVIGLDSLQGLQAARILSDRRVSVIGFANDPNHYACRTNVCQQIHYAEDSILLLRKLTEVGFQLAEKAVLVPCTDKYVRFVSRHRADLQALYHVVLPPSEIVDVLMNKVAFYTYAQQEGLPIPETFFLYGRDDVDHAAKNITFPCILKPSSRTGAWLKHTKKKGFKVSNPEELMALYDHYAGWSDALVAQAWVPGPDTNLYSCNCYFDVASEPLVTFVARKLRQWPPETGTSCLGEECRNDRVLQETISMFTNLEYHGLAYLEMKRDEHSGEYYIIEPNVGRPTGRSAIAEAGGVELLYTMYCDAVGWPLPDNRKQSYRGVKWVHLLRDFQSALYYWRQGDLTIKGWWASLAGRRVEALFSWRDPRPFLCALKNAIPVYLSRRERGKADY